MDELNAIIEKAEQKIKIADHLLTITYPVVKEPKLLILVIENIFESLSLTIDWTLKIKKIYEKKYETNFDEKFSVFKKNIVLKYYLNKEIIPFIEKIKKIIEEHKKTAVLFTRKEKLIITDENYNLTKITPDECKKIILKTKKYIKKIKDLIEEKTEVKNERMCR